MSAPPDLEAAQFVNEMLRNTIISNLPKSTLEGLVYFYYAITSGSWCEFYKEGHKDLLIMIEASPAYPVLKLYLTGTPHTAEDLQAAKVQVRLKG